MDYIYSKLNNNLVDINRLDKVLLLKCEEENVPVEGLKVGDYYLKFTVIDSDKVNYCSLADLSKDEEELNKLKAQLEQEIADRETAVEAEAEARESEILELREECSNITQGIQEFSNSVDIRFQEKEEGITKNFDSISALSDKETSDVSNLQTSIDQEVSDRKTAISDLKKDVVLITREGSDPEVKSASATVYFDPGISQLYLDNAGSPLTIEGNRDEAQIIIYGDESPIYFKNAYGGEHTVAYEDYVDDAVNDKITPLENRVAALEEKFDGSSMASLSFYYDDAEPK